MILQLYYFRPATVPLSVTVLACSLDTSPLYASCVQDLSRYCAIRWQMISLFFSLFFYVLFVWKKYYKPMQVSHCIADCVSWVPRLTLLDFQTNGLMNVLLEQSSFICRGLAIWKSHRHPPLKIVETVRRGEGLSSPVKSPLFSLEALSLHHTCSSPEWEGETGMTLVSMGREQVKTATCSTNPHSTSHLFPP